MQSIQRGTRQTSFPPESTETASASGTDATPKPTTEGPGRERGSGTNLVERFVAHATQPRAQQGAEERSGPAEPAMTAGALAFAGKARAKPPHTFLRSDGKPFPVSQDGTPLYKQNDRAEGGNWGGTKLGGGANATSIGRQGCALTAMAMALSKLTGQTLTPALLDAHLDAHNGYAKDSRGKETDRLRWQVVGNAARPPVTVTRLKQGDLDSIRSSLDTGRPVVLGVDYRKDEKTDHWVCLTRRDPSDAALYYANDPATGREICFRQDEEGRLVQVPGPGDKPLARPYRSSGEFVTFKPR
jgi:Peptidase_C39 like family